MPAHIAIPHSDLASVASTLPPSRPWWWRLFRLVRRVVCRRRPDEEHLVLVDVRADRAPPPPEAPWSPGPPPTKLRLVNVAADRSWSLCLVDLLHGGEADLCRHTGARFFPTSLVSGMPVEDQVRCDVEGPLRVLVELRQVADDGTVLFTVHAVVHATDLVLGRTRERLVSLVPGWIPTTTQTTQTTWTATQVKPHGY